MKKKGQIWIETVIYTLIGLAIIGVVLGIVKPAVDEKRDSMSIKQSVDVLSYIDENIEEIRFAGVSNSRPIEIKIGRGRMIIDGERDKIMINIENSKSKYSQPGQEISDTGSVKALTLENGKSFNVTLTLDYSNKMNITYRGQDNIQVFPAVSSNYNLAVKNNGEINGLFNMDFF